MAAFMQPVVVLKNRRGKNERQAFWLFIFKRNMKLHYNQTGKILSIDAHNFSVPFTTDYGFSYVFDSVEYPISLKSNGNSFCAKQNGIAYSLSYESFNTYFAVKMRIENQSGRNFSPELTVFNLGIDSYMESHPRWKKKFFPTLLRCEHSHLFGYFMSPERQILAVVSANPFVSYDYTYTKTETGRHLGHRITGQRLHITNSTNLQLGRVQAKRNLKSGEVYENTLYLIPLKPDENIFESIAKIGKVPMICGEKFTYDKGESPCLRILSNEEYTARLVSPSGQAQALDGSVLNEFGVHTLTVQTKSGKTAEARLYCKKDWEFYLKNAAKEAFLKPQKATTHAESWYGLFSMFLAAKRFQSKELFDKAMACFSEIMPLMFDFETCEPLVIPSRIQNTSTLVSLLTDIYECNKTENLQYLQCASKFADFLLKNQGKDGAYYNKNTHYTCVIYIAKSILELSLAEKNSGNSALVAKGEVHYQSVKRAIDELKKSLANIQTEGEQTLEDGMISCSALQIGMFATTLPQKARVEYIQAAEHMMQLHSCLEQSLIPDCRMRGASLRFWEAQYDVMVRANFFNSPHGWSAWTAYAYYYLYLLTGKKEYLLHLMDVTAACIQLMSTEGELRWAFCAQPYVKATALVKGAEIQNQGYLFSKELGSSNRGKYTLLEFGEGYVPMISDWFRIAENKVVGGYEFCPLTLQNERYIIDNTGGCCDNDVHEIFKFLEETVYDKAFIYENEDGTFLTYGLRILKNGSQLQLEVINHETTICYNFKTPKAVVIAHRSHALNGLGMVSLAP